MNLNNLPKMVLGIVLTLIVVSAVAIPVIETTQESIYTNYSNTGYYYSEPVDESVTIEYAGSAPVIKVNDVQITTVADRNYPIIVSDSFMISRFCSVPLANIEYIADDGKSTNIGFITGGKFVIDPTERTITCSNLTYQDEHSGVTDLTVNYDKYAFNIAENGSYVIYTPASGSSADMYLPEHGWYTAWHDSTPSQNNNYAFFDGEKLVKQSNAGMETSITNDSENITGYNEVTKATITDAAGSDVYASFGSVAYYNAMFIVPAVVHGVSNDNQVVHTLISIVPLILVIAMLIGIVGTLLIKRL